MLSKKFILKLLQFSILRLSIELVRIVWLKLNINFLSSILTIIFFPIISEALLANDKNIIASVKQVLGENIYIWSSAFFEKAQGEEAQG